MKTHSNTYLVGAAALIFVLTLSFSVHAQNGGTSGFNAQSLIGPQVPLTSIWSGSVSGDYVAAGVGMRNLGSGSVSIAIPAGATISNAWMFWAVVWSGSPPAMTADINGTTVNGTLLGTSGSPCWGGSGINFYYANVSGNVVVGANALANFPSGLTNGAPPQGGAVFPLCEGASLVVVFSHPAWDMNTVSVYGGAQTFANQVVTNGLGSFTGWSGGNPADQLAHTTFIEADGQARFAGGRTFFNGTLTSGPGTAIKTADAFDGADGIIPVSATDGIWDTHTLNVSSLFTSGVNTATTASTSASGDCLSWGAQVVSVKTALNAFIDIKAGSCPNSFNINSNGKLPVAILGTAWFNVADIDPSTVMLEGVSPTKAPSMSDVSMPYMAFPMGCYDCNTGGADGRMDLNLKFETQDVVAALGSVQNGDCKVVKITGNLMNGTPFEGTDVLRIIDNSHPKSGAGIAGYELTLEQNAPNPIMTGTTFQYSLPGAMDVQLEVYNTLGQRVATVFRGVQGEGIQNIAWDGLSDRGLVLPPGSYVYRLHAGDQVISKMLVIAR
jgi:hypothetical protein